MRLEIGTIIFLCLIIVFLLWQRSSLLLRQKKRELNEKVIQSLHAYPVHQYTMAHMLERCLAIVFSASQLYLSPKGAIFLMQNETLKIVAQRGLNDCVTNIYQESSVVDYLHNIVAETDRFQFISSSEIRCRQHKPELFVNGLFVVPLIRNNTLIGLLTLHTLADYKVTNEEIKFIKSVGITVSSLIERKQIADELRLGNSVIELSQQAIFITDNDNNIIRCNKACERMTGYSSKELMGKNPRVLKSDRQSMKFYVGLWQQVSEKGYWQGEIWNKHRNGMEFVEWLTISSIKDADAQVIQYLAIFTDMTSVKKRQDIQSKAVS